MLVANPVPTMHHCGTLLNKRSKVMFVPPPRMGHTAGRELATAVVKVEICPSLNDDAPNVWWSLADRGPISAEVGPNLVVARPNLRAIGRGRESAEIWTRAWSMPRSGFGRARQNFVPKLGQRVAERGETVCPSGAMSDKHRSTSARLWSLPTLSWLMLPHACSKLDRV